VSTRHNSRSAPPAPIGVTGRLVENIRGAVEEESTWGDVFFCAGQGLFCRPTSVNCSQIVQAQGTRQKINHESESAEPHLNQVIERVLCKLMREAHFLLGPGFTAKRALYIPRVHGPNGGLFYMGTSAVFLR